MNRIIRYTYPRGTNQYSLLAGLEPDAAQLFQSALSELAVPTFSHRFPIDLYEDKDNTYVRAELPGVIRDAITVEMVDGYLNISATRKRDDESFGLNRSVAIPESVQVDKVVAAYENGVLTVTLPKAEEAKPKQVRIAVK